MKATAHYEPVEPTGYTVELTACEYHVVLLALQQRAEQLHKKGVILTTTATLYQQWKEESR